MSDDVDGDGDCFTDVRLRSARYVSAPNLLLQNRLQDLDNAPAVIQLTQLLDWPVLQGYFRRSVKILMEVSTRAMWPYMRTLTSDHPVHSEGFWLGCALAIHQQPAFSFVLYAVYRADNEPITIILKYLGTCCTCGSGAMLLSNLPPFSASCLPVQSLCAAACVSGWPYLSKQLQLSSRS